jgi:hypothetical protein
MPRFALVVRYLVLSVLFLVACEAPPTMNQVTSRAVKRNCEAQGNAAATEIRKQSAQIVKEGGTTNQNDKDNIEARALEAQQDTFKSCMLKYAV